jgi:hypothetical protein
MFKKRVLDVAIKQINEHSDLQVSCLMEGEHRRKKPLKYITFYVKKQSVLVLPIEFENQSDTQPATTDTRKENLLVILDALGIKAKNIVEKILADDNLITEVFRFNYQLKTGQLKVEKNAAGLLLTRLGITKTKK